MISRLASLAWPVLRAHWRAVAVVLLALVAALGIRGCAAQQGRAEAASAQLDAQFKAALWEAKKIPSLAAGMTAAGKDGAKPVGTFSGRSSRQTIKPLPSAPVGPPVAPGACEGITSDPPCVLRVGESYDFAITSILFKKKDSGQYALADVALDASNGLHIEATVEAPVTLPAPDNPAVGAEIKRSRFAVRGGVVNPWKPSGGYLGGGVRALGPLWLEGDARVTDKDQSIGLGARWEW